MRLEEPREQAPAVERLSGAADPDALLMLRFQRGDADAFESLFLRYRRPLFQFVLRFTGNRARAEEMIQETFLKVIQNAGSYTVRAKFSTYIFRIARNLCLDHVKRAEGRHQTVSLHQPRGQEENGPTVGETLRNDSSTPQEEAVEKERGELLQTLIAALPPEQREVFLLRQVKGLKFHEIAKVVGCSSNTTKSRMRYALESLRAGLRKLDMVK
jgi:RNA polymerase sigma-70 factor (ECF subfamily)